MKDNPNRLKKWLFSYFLINFVLFFFGYFGLYMRSDLFGITGLRYLVISFLSFIITFFFYLKVTKKPATWTLITILLAYFFSALLALFLTSIMNIPRNTFSNYAISRFFWIFFSTLFMFAGVFSEQKKAIRNWEDDILDDTNL